MQPCEFREDLALPVDNWWGGPVIGICARAPRNIPTMTSTEQSTADDGGSTSADQRSEDGKDRVGKDSHALAPEEAQAGGEDIDDPRLVRLGWALTLLPFVVAAVALFVSGYDTYHPAADHAMIEARTSDVLEHPPLVGLYSRGDWSHPGPLMFFVLAPFYLLTGGASIATHLGALAINGGSVAGMALLARRRGGLPLMLCTVVASGLLMRTLGAEFLHDPWNTYLPVFPFGLMIFLTWSMACGDRWALPAAVFVASFLAQTHVGFVALASPLLAWGALWLFMPVFRAGRPDPSDPSTDPDDNSGESDGAEVSNESSGESWRERLRPLVVPALAAAAVGLLVWLPPAVDVLRNNPSNAQRVARWFNEAEGGVHTLGDGVSVMAGQFGLPSEWLFTKQSMTYTGESPFLDGRLRVPWLLVPVAIAALYLWSRRQADKRHLMAVVGLSLLIGVVSVWRTVGPAFDYRLRWTWVPPMVALAMVGWAAWLAAKRRWPAGTGRWLAPAALAVLMAVSGVNAVTAARAGEPLAADTEVVTALGPSTLESLPEGDGVVYVREPFHLAAWYSRGLVIYLEREGVDVRVEPELALHFGAHRVYDGEPIRAELMVMSDEGIAAVADQPGLTPVAEWTSEYSHLWEQERAEREGAQEAFKAGEIDESEYQARVSQLTTPEIGATAYRVVVYLVEQP